MRKVYLNNMPLEEARDLFINRVKLERKTEMIPVTEGLGRVTSREIIALNSMPNFPASAMDGIAVKASSTYGANEAKPVVLIKNNDYIEVDTGDPIPNGFDAVIMIEDVQPLDEKKIEISAPAAPWQHVRAIGEDVVAGEIVIFALHKLTPPDLGVLLAAGVTEIEVIKPLVFSIIPTGTELVEPGSDLRPGDIVEFNGTVIKNYLKEWGAEGNLYSIIPDDYSLIKLSLKKAVESSDVVIINAGSSAGRDDYSSRIISELGEVYVHGVATKPGKPVILGTVDNTPVIGLPGYPVSAYLNLDWFIKPLVERYYGIPERKRQTINARLGRRLASSLGSEEFVRMSLGWLDGAYIANPLNRGAGVTMSLVKAQGILRIPAHSLGVDQGEEVEVELLKPLEDIKNTILFTGSHDLILDIIGSQLKIKNHSVNYISSHLGSMAGIIAIGKGEAHGAGIHLLDPATGEYNLSYIQKLLKNQEVVLINLVYRQQGFLVAKGNPLGIKGIEDLTKDGIKFINRQKGSGTRVLLDYLLSNKEIYRKKIYGYEREEYTHLNVAAAVANGVASTGLAIKGAAQVYDLDFIPIGEERYDLLFTKSFYESPLCHEFLEVINSAQFKAQVDSLGGYSTRETGRVIYSGIE